MTSPIDLQDKLRELRVLPSETEWIEFKEAKNNFDFDDLGKYFSALSNEANLKNQPSGWLVFGLRDKPIPRQIVGTNYRPQRPDLDSLKEEIANGTSCLQARGAGTPWIDFLQAPQLLCPPFGLSVSWGWPLTGGSHHRHRVCQPLGLMDQHSSLKKYGEATRSQIDRLLEDKLSDALDKQQKKYFVTNLLQEMKRQGRIQPSGATRWVKWKMSVFSPSEKSDENC